ncbi:class I SAM-dependent methyltransferase [uncultured Methanomethylovorans sp.]|uniref:class I SAM-dependent methyltransferase n=1 Tax=uncultured Methanomethylovorans sp. TaxID=183759 RepID=UPI002AA67E2F|nr:class I SAM-dependent methyltransferase [uncultured Methanomethylovorans sp.]
MEYGKIDWNDIWKELMTTQQRLDKTGDKNNHWNKKENAERFWKRTKENSEKTDSTLNELPLTPESRVLDIGSGPGRLAIPIAKKVSHVTAVEPAAGMMEILKENTKQQGIDNISYVSKCWEDIDVENDLDAPYDVVIASFSLGMPDIKEAIQKMQQTSSKYVYLYWFAGTTPWEEHSITLWPSLYGKNYVPGPKCDVLYNLLYNMGIYPDVHVFSMDYTNYFSSVEEAMDFYRDRYVIETQEQENILHHYLKDILVPENGQMIERGNSTRVKISWEKK